MLLGYCKYCVLSIEKAACFIYFVLDSFLSFLAFLATCLHSSFLWCSLHPVTPNWLPTSCHPLQGDLKGLYIWWGRNQRFLHFCALMGTLGRHTLNASCLMYNVYRFNNATLSDSDNVSFVEGLQNEWSEECSSW